MTWRVPVRSGFAGPAVAGGRVFVLDWEDDPESRRMDGSERVTALDELTGDVLSTHTWPATYRSLTASCANGHVDQRNDQEIIRASLDASDY